MTGARLSASRARVSRDAVILAAVIAACGLVYAITAVSTGTAAAVAVLVVVAAVFWLVHEDLARLRADERRRP